MRAVSGRRDRVATLAAVTKLSSQVWKDVNGWALEIGISCTYSNPVVTGGRKHTHTLCSDANEVFHCLNLTNKWNIPQNHRADAFVTLCYNCRLPEHTSDKCSLPCNEAKIQRLRRLVPSLLLKGVHLAVVVMVLDVVVVVGVTLPKLGSNGVRMMALLTLSQIKLQPMVLRREMALG